MSRRQRDSLFPCFVRVRDAADGSNESSPAMTLWLWILLSILCLRVRRGTPA